MREERGKERKKEFERSTHSRYIVLLGGQSKTLPFIRIIHVNWFIFHI